MDEDLRLDPASFPGELTRGGEEVFAAERLECGV
jgi:hypothetical protein